MLQKGNKQLRSFRCYSIVYADRTDHTEQEYICPERTRSSHGNRSCLSCLSTQALGQHRSKADRYMVCVRVRVRLSCTALTVINTCILCTRYVDFHHLEGVALVDEVLLPLGGVVHLRGVRADERVEERVEPPVYVRLS